MTRYIRSGSPASLRVRRGELSHSCPRPSRQPIIRNTAAAIDHRDSYADGKASPQMPLQNGEKPRWRHGKQLRRCRMAPVSKKFSDRKNAAVGRDVTRDKWLRSMIADYCYFTMSSNAGRALMTAN